MVRVANYLFNVVSVFEKWASGEDISEKEVYEASRLLGTPTRKLEVFLQRYRDVFGRIIEERCSDAPRGRVCIYTWSRWAFKRYFPAALDAGGTIVWYPEPGLTKLVSYPLHRAYDLDVHGVKLPESDPDAAVPRLDGWQVNLYFDEILSRWVFSTRYVLHNMRFEGKQLVVEDYGRVVNPLVETAEKIATRKGVYGGLEEMKGWTLTFMVMGEEPASVRRGLPDPDEYENYDLVLIAARKPNGELVPPFSEELNGLSLPVKTLVDTVLRGDKDTLLTRASKSIEYPSMFLWYLDDVEHPSFYEAKSQFYNDYMKAIHKLDAKSLVVLITSGNEEVVERLRQEIGTAVDEAREALLELRTILEKVSPNQLAKALARAGLGKQAKDAVRAIEKGKYDRALRIIAASAVTGLGVGEVGFVLKSVAEKIKEASATSTTNSTS